MAETIRISLDTTQYAPPTQEDLNNAKRFVLRREEYARQLQQNIDDILADAAERIVTICYKYDVDPKTFSINSEYNPKMMAEIAAVMDEIEEAILNLINEYATAVTTDKSRINILALWMVRLGRRNLNLQQTLDNYLFKFMKDIEAAVAAMRSVGVGSADARTKIRTHLHAIYTMPEVTKAITNPEAFNATFIRSRGVDKGAQGLSNNGSTNVINMAVTTLQMVWNRAQAMEFEQQGAIGYYQLRGSAYTCDICDAEVGFHLGITSIYEKPLPHPHCMCYRIPIYPITQ